MPEEHPVTAVAQPDAERPEEEVRSADRPVVGEVGARFPRPSNRHRRTQPDLDQETTQPLPVVSEPLPGQSLGAVAEGAVAEAKNPGPADPEKPAGAAEPAVDEAEWDGTEETYCPVRPYSWTKGRTASARDLAVEALVSAAGKPPDAAAPAEHHAVLSLCNTPRSVAELAALLSVPLGVVRVLLSDMAEAGSVLVHRTAGAADGAPDLALMQRVLTCLQRL